MMVTIDSSELLELRDGLRRIRPPYLLRKYEATEADYESIADEDLRCEFVDGVLVVHSPASFQHESRIAFLTTLLGSFVASRSPGWVCGSNMVMQLGQRRFCPDLSFLATGHGDRIRGGRVVGPMDLVIEVISPNTRDYDLGEKRAAYHAGHIPEIWLIDPELRQCQIDLLEGEVYRAQTLTSGRFVSRVLPGLSLDVTWFWTDPLPNPLDCLKAATGGA